jgi:hypothetical protein
MKKNLILLRHNKTDFSKTYRHLAAQASIK